jgi:VWFA-related protein
VGMSQRGRIPGLAWLALCGALGLAPARASAQAPPGALAPRPGAQIQKGAEQNTIHVKVEIVSAPVVVRDAHGEMVVSLDQKDFKIFDNGVEQKIDHFDMGGDPLSIVLVVEASERVEALLPAIRKAGIVFSQAVLGDSGRGAVIAFGGDVNVVQPFTKNHDELEKVIGKLEDDGDAKSRLYDALAEAENLLEEEPINRRRVIVAMTEAVDRGSSNKLGLLLRTAQQDNITIYSVGLSTTAAELRASAKDNRQQPSTPYGTFPEPAIPGEPQSPSTPGLGAPPGGAGGGADLLALGVWAVTHGANVVRAPALGVATVATGGEHVPTFKDRSIEQALDRIGGELHAEYTLGYHPTGVPTVGYHEIRVVVDRPKTTVRTRPGYYLPADEN